MPNPRALRPTASRALRARISAFPAPLAARVLLVSLLAWLAGACVTGEAWEQETGAEVSQQVEQSIGVIEGDLADYVARVGELLVERGKPGGGPYRFHLVDMVEPNAFALPGGYIYVSRGILTLFDDEDELAGVLAHEIGHVAGRHHLKSRWRAVPFLPVNIAAAISSAAVGMVSPSLGGLVGALGQAPGGLVLATHSRSQEREADEIGQRIAAASGWDPRGLSRVMHSLAREQAFHGSDPNRRSFFASHPTSPEREKATAERAETLTIASHPGVATSRRAFLKRLVGLLVGPSGAQGVFVESRFIHPDLDFTLLFPEDWELENTPQAVAGGPEDGLAAVILSIAPEQSDAMEAAAAALDEIGGRVVEEPTATRINGLPAARAQVQRRDVSLLAHWVEHGDAVYAIAGITEPAAYDERKSGLTRVAESFRPLRGAERSQVRESRIRIFEGSSGETLDRIVKRASSTWNPEQAAIANGLAAGEPLSESRPVKLPVSVPYRKR